jgi:hypothetical protein
VFSKGVVINTATNENSFVNNTTHSASTTEHRDRFINKQTKSKKPASQPITGIKETAEASKTIIGINLISIFTKLNFVASQIQRVDINTSIAKIIAKIPIFIHVLVAVFIHYGWLKAVFC